MERRTATRLGAVSALGLAVVAAVAHGHRAPPPLPDLPGSAPEPEGAAATPATSSAAWSPKPAPGRTLEVVDPDSEIPAVVEGPAAEVVRRILEEHADEDNPRNRNQRAYTSDPPERISSAQVGIRATGWNRITLYQYVQQSSTRVRTFSIELD